VRTAAARPFSGAEPLVGEVVGLRTFRVDETGLLLPLYSNQAWYDGTNTASCDPPVGAARPEHPVVAPDCECGFYAYGSEGAAASNRQLRYVQAVVSCWGRVVAGTQGFRAEHARIDALWLAPNLPKWTRARVLMRYPGACVYDDRAAMLAEHPLSYLPCYEAPPRRPVLRRGALTLFAAAVMVLGLLPWSWIDGVVLVLWAVVMGWLGLAIAALATLQRRPGRGAGIGLLLFAVAWLAAPAFGLVGWVLRLPVLRAAAVAAVGYLVALRPGYFPIVTAPRERAFCGVRPSS
jgi:hypothetical protein